MAAITRETSLLSLPTELLQAILSLLEPFDLAACAKTCRELASSSYDDIIWGPIVNACAGERVIAPAPLQSFRSLYVSLFPYWFLAQHRIWFADTAPSGKLLVARYIPTMGCITAYQVVAVTARSSSDFSFWEKDREVIIQNFHPTYNVDTNQPVLKLDADTSVDQATAQTLRYDREVPMEIATNSGLHSSFMLCRALPDGAIYEGAAVWPSTIFPAASRARNTSHDGFRSVGHRPSNRHEISSNNFRIRKWAEYGTSSSSSSSSPFSGTGSRISAALGIGLPWFMNDNSSSNSSTSRDAMLRPRIPEHIASYSSLPVESYTASAEKPWQGIWCGDYNGHGCEFLLITQPSQEDAKPLPAGMDFMMSQVYGGEHTEEERTNGTPPPDITNTTTTDDETEVENAASSSSRRVQNLDQGPTGRLEAIKLTGDTNIPLGKYSFIAPDIGNEGLIRVADEHPFQGSRVVRSAGHIAERGFSDDRYTPSQLILISHNRLAQYWQSFRHISYYERVNLDSLLPRNLDEANS